MKSASITHFFKLILIKDSFYLYYNINNINNKSF